MDLSLKNRTAIVCGSSQGIGRSVAVELAQLGANLVLIARNEARLQATLEQLPAQTSQQHRFLIADFQRTDQVQAAIDQFISDGHTADILVNNTGGPAPGSAMNATTDQFLTAFQAHLIANHILTTAVVPGMQEKGFGRIINVISTSVKQPLDGLGVSNTIRGAVASWAKTLANELGRFGITVNNVLPGMTHTGRLDAIIAKKAEQQNCDSETIVREMEAETPAGRIGLPHEIAAAVAFLASPAAAYINGVNLPVDGGRTKCL